MCASSRIESSTARATRMTHGSSVRPATTRMIRRSAMRLTTMRNAWPATRRRGAQMQFPACRHPARGAPRLAAKSSRKSAPHVICPKWSCPGRISDSRTTAFGLSGRVSHTHTEGVLELGFEAFAKRDTLRLLSLVAAVWLVVPPGAGPPPQGGDAEGRVRLVEVPPQASGVGWVHDNGRSEARHLPETCGGGGVFFDYDNDGWMDIYLVNGGPADFYEPGKPLRNALYHNNRDGTFTDVAEKAGAACGKMGHFGMGAAAADFDGDGWTDLYITNYGHNVLLRNNGDGTFTDVTAKAGVAAPNWSTCATWFDYDNDGKLDLFVSSFVEYSAAGSLFCGNNRLGRRYYCIPRVFKPRPSFLFHNSGDGTFTDVSRKSGIA